MKLKLIFGATYYKSNELRNIENKALKDLVENTFANKKLCPFLRVDYDQTSNEFIIYYVKVPFVDRFVRYSALSWSINQNINIDNIESVKLPVKIETQTKAIPNYYKNAYYRNHFNKISSNTLTLNRAFWNIILSHEEGRNDIEFLNECILKSSENPRDFDIDKNNNICQNKEVLAHIKNKKSMSYNELKEFMYIKYGFDIHEYFAYKQQELYKTGYHLINLQEGITSIFKKLKSQFQQLPHKNVKTELDEIFENDPQEILPYQDEITAKIQKQVLQSTLPPYYKQEYDFPLLKILDAGKLIIEFNLFETKIFNAKTIDDL